MKTVIFDLDGTLLNTLSDLTNSTNFALSAHGYPVRTEKEIRSFVGNGMEKQIRRSLPTGTEADFDAVLETYKEHYHAHANDHTVPYPGVIKMLEKLNQNGITCAVFSNKPDFAVQELQEQHYPKLVALSRGAVPGTAKKPDPEGLFVILDTLGAGRDEAVFVGDSEVDFQTGKNSGLPFYLVTWGFRDREQLAALGDVRLADTAEELTEKLLSHFGVKK